MGSVVVSVCLSIHKNMDIDKLHIYKYMAKINMLNCVFAHKCNIITSNTPNLDL